MEKDKNICVIYALNPIDMDAELELMELLQELGYSLNLMRSVRELNIWMRSTISEMPTLFITDVSNEHVDFNSIRAFLSNVSILSMNEEATNEGVSDNGNRVNAFKTYDEVINYLKKEDYSNSEAALYYQSKESIGFYPENAQPLFTNENQIENLNEHYTNFPFKSENEGPPLMVDSPGFDDPHPALQRITEFNHSTNEAFMPPSEEITSQHEKQEIRADAIKEIAVPQDSLMEGNPYDKRSRDVQKGIFAGQHQQGHRMVGIWSPLHRMGVTSLSLNFSFFLAQNRINIAVLEGITGQYAMKDWLKRYTPVPPNWISCARAIQTDATPMYTKWKYCNIMFFPLEKNDPQYEWNSLSLDAYMNTSKVKDIDVTLVDMPTGKMARHTLDSLHHLDELWIVVDDSIQEILAWKTYIRQVGEKKDMPTFLVFNKHYSFSQNERIAKELGVPLISSIPSLHEETMQNYYERDPLYFRESVQEKVDEAFEELAIHLFKGKFTLKKDGNVLKKATWKSKLLAPFKLPVTR